MPDLKVHPDESPENPLARIGFFDELNSPNVPAYTLPRVAGTSGQVITIDANGDCNFQNVGSIGALGSVEFRALPYYDEAGAAGSDSPADLWDPTGKSITPEVYFNLSQVNYSATPTSNTWRYKDGWNGGLNFIGGTQNTGVTQPTLEFATYDGTTLNPQVTGSFIYRDSGGIDYEFAFTVNWILIQEGAAGTDGAAGISARAVNLIASDQTIEYDTDGTNPNPSSVTITATAVNASESEDVYFEFFVNDENQDVSPAAAGDNSPFTNSFTLTSDATIGNPKKIEVQIREGSLSNPILARDQITIFGLKQGSDAITISFTNDAHVLPTLSNGTVDYSNSGTDIEVFQGTNQLVYDEDSPHALSSYRITAVGSNVSVDSSPTFDPEFLTSPLDLYSPETGYVRRYGEVHNMSADSASIEYTITIRDSEGKERIFTRKQSLAKSLQGAEGSSGQGGRTVSLSAVNQIFEYNTAGEIPNPSDTIITAQAFNTEESPIGDLFFEFFVDDEPQGSGPADLTGDNSPHIATFTYTPRSSIGDMPDKIEVEIREGSATAPVIARDQFTVFGVQQGSDAITIAMTNEGHTINTGPSGDSPSTYPGSGTEFNVLEGATLLKYDNSPPGDNGSFRISTVANSNITIGAATTPDANTREYGDHSDMVNKSEKIVYQITVKRADGREQTFTRSQSLSKSIDGEEGAPGADAKTVRITADDYVIEYDQSGKNPTPSSTITLTAKAQNFVDPYFKFTDVSPEETDYTDGTGDTDTVTFSVPDTYSSIPKTIRVGVAEASAANDEIAFDSTTIASVKEGSGNIGVFLNNDSHVFPANSSGEVTDYSGSGTRIEVYEGATELDYDGVGTSPGTFTVSASGTNITPGSISEYDSPRLNSPEGYKALVGPHSGVNDGINTSTIVYTISGTRGNGDAFSTTKNQTFTKSKTGTDAAAVKLIADTHVIPYAVKGDESPETEVGFTTEIQSITNPYYEFYVNKLDGNGDVIKRASSTDSTFTLADGDEPAIGKSVTVKVKVYEGDSPGVEEPVAIDSVSIYAVQGGSDAIIGFLTRPSYIVVAENDGTVDTADLGAAAGGTYKVFVGNTDVTTSCTFSVLSESGVDVSIGESTGANSPAGTSTGVYTVSSMSANQGTATFQAVIPEEIARSSSNVTLTADYSISKSIEGASVTGPKGNDGARKVNGILYWSDATIVGTASQTTTDGLKDTTKTLSTYNDVIDGDATFEVANTTDDAATFYPVNTTNGSPNNNQLNIDDLNFDAGDGYIIRPKTDIGDAATYDFTTTGDAAFNNLDARWSTEPPEVQVNKSYERYWEVAFSAVETLDGDGAGTGSGPVTFGTPVPSIRFGVNIQSDNFRAGLEGWQIQRDSGDAEFNNVTARGSLKGGKTGPKDYLAFQSPNDDSPAPFDADGIDSPPNRVHTGFYIGPDDRSPTSYDFIIGDDEHQVRFDGSKGRLDLKGVSNLGVAGRFEAKGNASQPGVVIYDFANEGTTTANETNVSVRMYAGTLDAAENNSRVAHIVTRTGELGFDGSPPYNTDGRYEIKDANPGEMTFGAILTFEQFKFRRDATSADGTFLDIESDGDAHFYGNVNLDGGLGSLSGGSYDYGSSGYVPTADGSGGWSWAAQTGASSSVTGSGDENKIAKWSGSNALTNSLITDDGSTVTVAGNLTVNGGNITVSGTVDGRDVAADGSKLDNIEPNATADQSASEILTAIKTVDGSGSGLDADTVDGIQASSFLRSDVADTASGVITFGDDLIFTNRTTTDGHIQLYNGDDEVGGYAIGVESQTLYYRSDNNYRWYIDTFADGGNNDYMELSKTALTVNAGLIVDRGTVPDNTLALTVKASATGSVVVEHRNESSAASDTNVTHRYAAGPDDNSPDDAEVNLITTHEYNTANGYFEIKAIRNVDAGIFFTFDAVKFRNQARTTTFLDIDSSGNVQFHAGIEDKDGQLGTSGQVLSSTGSQVNWIDASSGTVTGTGTENKISKWSGTSGELTDSTISDNGTSVTIDRGTVTGNALPLIVKAAANGENNTGGSVVVEHRNTSTVSADTNVTHRYAAGPDDNSPDDAEVRLITTHVHNTANGFFEIKAIRNVDLGIVFTFDQVKFRDVSQNETLVIEADGDAHFYNRVGIGRSPTGSYELDVDGDINFTGNLTQNGSTYGGSGGTLTGNGNANKIAKWSGSTALTDSLITDDGTTVTVAGNLTVNGTTTTVNTTNTTITDNLLELNSGASSNSNDSGIIIERGSTGDNALFIWDESADKFALGTTTATASSTGNITYTDAGLQLSTLNVSGDLTSSGSARIIIKKDDNNVSDHIQFFNGTTRVGEIGCEDTSWLRINQETAANIYTPRYIRSDGGFFVDGTAKGINGSGNFIGGTIAGASDYGTLLRSDAADTATGQIFFDAGFDAHPIMLSGAQNFDNIDRSGFYNLYNTQTSSTNSPPLDYGTMIVVGNDKGSSGFGLQIAHERTGAGFYVRGMNDTGSTWYDWDEIWTSGTDGSGSGLDADLLDGVQASSFLRSDANDSASGSIDFTGDVDFTNYLRTDEIRAYSGQDLTITCGESYGSLTKSTYNDEVIRLAGEGGVKVFASSDNLSSGLNKETTLINTAGDMYIDRRVYIGNSSSYFFTDSGTRTAYTGGDFYIQSGVTNYYNYATNQYIGNVSGDNIYFRGNALSGNTWKIEADGDVGIGTTSPSYKLEVNGTLGVVGDATFDSDVYAGGTTGTLYYNLISEGTATQTRDKIRLWTASPYNIGFKSGYSFGGLGGASSTDYAMSFQMSNSDNRGWWWGDSSHTDAQGAMSLTTLGKASIAHSLNLGYGESSTTVPGSSYTLDVNGTGHYTGLLYLGTNDTTVGNLTMYSTSSGSEGPQISMHVANTLGTGGSGNVDQWNIDVKDDDLRIFFDAIGFITMAGHQTVRANRSFTVEGAINSYEDITAFYSDERLKTRDGIIENPIEKVKSLTGFYFRGNEQAGKLGYDTEKRQVGLSAQEVEKVLPEVIKPAPVDDKYKTLDYAKIVPLLVEAIKEQQEQIENLQKKLEEMSK